MRGYGIFSYKLLVGMNPQALLTSHLSIVFSLNVNILTAIFKIVPVPFIEKLDNIFSAY